MSENDVIIGGEVDDSNIISGSGNTIIQIINKVYKKGDLNKFVVSSFEDAAELQALWEETFPALESKPRQHKDSLQTQSPHEALINDFKRGNEMTRLLGEIKKRNPKKYRNFLASQVLEAIGLSTKDIPLVKTSAKAVEKELLRLQKTAISQQKTMRGDSLEFEDRDDLFKEIHLDRNFRHVVLHGPSGVGKTYFLKHFQEKYSHDTRCVYIDLDSCKMEDILGMAIEQLCGEKGSNTSYLELATAISTLHDGEPRINRFYFLFDNADQNQAAINYLFGPDNIIENPALTHILEDWNLKGRIQLKIVLVARHPVRPSTIHPAFSSKMQKKMVPLPKPSIQNMLEKLTSERHIPLDLIAELSNEVYYVTGGHPKCAKQMLVALAEMGCVRPTEEEWEQIFKENVIATIYAEMLKSIDLEILSIIWTLGIFRRFDQRLLGGLLDRGLLPSLPGDKSRQARDLRAKLEQINLFDADKPTSTITTNYAMRQAISLNMQHDAPERYKMLTMIALEMFLDRFQSSEAGLEKQIERMVINLFEILYHWTKLMEIEMRGKKPRPDSGLICTRICEAFENYLLFALTLMRDEDRPAFFQFLGTRWADDEELQETIRRVTRRDDCLQIMEQVLNKYDTIQDGVD